MTGGDFVHRRGGARGAAATLGSAVLALACMTALPSCTPPQLLTLRSGLDSLRTVVDSTSARDAADLAALRRDVAQQRDLILTSGASSGTTIKELVDQMATLEGKLDEVSNRLIQYTSRGGPSTAPSTTTPVSPGGSAPGGSAPVTTSSSGGGESNQVYDQAAQDLTQGRYDLALKGFREFVARYPKAELADNAQYGVGESFFAQSRFDSAAAEYARVEVLYPEGDKMPAALYKLALSQEKLGRPTDSRATLDRLVRKYPLSGEAQLAKERLGGPRRR